MMMCIGSVRDFEAQLTGQTRTDSVKLAAQIERATRSEGWEWSRLWEDSCQASAVSRTYRAPIEPPRPYSHGRRFIPAWLADAREQSMPDGFSEDIGRTYSDLGSQARGAQHQTWIATFGSSVLRGRKVDPGEHYCGNFGIHGTVGMWLA